MSLFPKTVHAPEIADVGALSFPWFNTEPLSTKLLRGRVICFDFWDYTCVNCIRTLPYMEAWHEKYHDLGLTIVGIHAPEFQFAHQTSNVERGIHDFGLRYPIVLDNEYKIWQSFANQYWPAKYLVDEEGYIRYAHFGEGKYRDTEHIIQMMLKMRDTAIVLPPLMEAVRETDREGAVCYRVTPELYLGHRRGRFANPDAVAPDAVREFSPQTVETPESLYVQGRWHCGDEYLQYAGGGAHAGGVEVIYTAKEVNLVMAPGGASGRVQVLQEGVVVKEDAGRDVGPDGWITVDAPRMYYLVNNREFGRHHLTLRFETPGTQAFAFTFVSMCKSAPNPAHSGA